MRSLLSGLLLLLLSVHGWPALAAKDAPAIDPLQRVWRDAQGGWYSVLVDEAGALTVHPVASGRFLGYTLQDGLAAPKAGAPQLQIAERSLSFGGVNLQPWSGRSEWFAFQHDGLRFHGVLSLPPGEGPFPLVINAHGSGREAATGFDWAASWYAQAGYATLIFDKRGTGQSGGEYTHDFDLLAGDLLAALAAVAADPRIDAQRIGLGGYSQGVYVATLAASRSPQVAFVIASFGMTESPLREDLLETKLHFEAHYPALAWAEFEPLVLACQQAFALRDDRQWPQVKDTLGL